MDLEKVEKLNGGMTQCCTKENYPIVGGAVIMLQVWAARRKLQKTGKINAITSPQQQYHHQHTPVHVLGYFCHILQSKRDI